MNRRRTGRARPWVIACGAAAAIVVAIVLIVRVPRSAPPPDRASTASASASAPAQASNSYRPEYHLTPASHWMNDPQRPFLLDGTWHAYYLYNADYPGGNGTEWRHVTSTDLVHWHDHGVAIQKYANGLGDIETGSAVVDTDGVAGFGRGAVIAIVTQQLDGVQRQSLFYSTDKGYHFRSFRGNPIMENPGQKDWRDPKVVYDSAHSAWTMTLAEGSKVGFYTSADLRQWNYVSGFETEGIGTVECPDLFATDIDGDRDRRTWVLAASANDAASGGTTGFAYWTGSWDGTTFHPDTTEPQWLDRGADFYAAVTWPDPHAADRRFAIAWMNNWSYATSLPTDGWQGGSDTIVRSIRLEERDGTATLVSAPVSTLDRIRGAPRTVSLGKPATVPAASRVHVVFDAGTDLPATSTLTIRGGGHSEATITYDRRAGTVSLDRSKDALSRSSAANDTYRAVRSTSVEPVDGRVTLDIDLDRMSVEIFPHRGIPLTSLVFLPGDDRTLSISHGVEDQSVRVQTYTSAR